MVEYSEDNAKGALAQLLNNLISIANMIIVAHRILLLISVEAMIRRLVQPAPLSTPS
jgi:hypothetical protein